jgi:hypothetical protein
MLLITWFAVPTVSKVPKTFHNFLVKLLAGILASSQRKIEIRKVHDSSGTDCLSERAQNPAQSLKLLFEIAYAFNMKLNILDRLVQSNARLEGKAGQSQQPRSKADRFCCVNDFDSSEIVKG